MIGGLLFPEPPEQIHVVGPILEALRHKTIHPKAKWTESLICKSDQTTELCNPQRNKKSTNILNIMIQELICTPLVSSRNFQYTHYTGQKHVNKSSHNSKFLIKACSSVLWLGGIWYSEQLCYFIKENEQLSFIC